MSDIADKVRSLGYLRRKGQSREKKVLDERNGRVAGKHIEHWDDHQDAVVTPQTVRLKIGVTEDGD